METLKLTYLYLYGFPQRSPSHQEFAQCSVPNKLSDFFDHPGVNYMDLVYDAASNHTQHCKPRAEI